MEPIEISQNWLLKFFHIKPASRAIILPLSKVKARREIARTLNDWDKYGLKDVVVERREGQDVIRGRVDLKNCECVAKRIEEPLLTLPKI